MKFLIFDTETTGLFDFAIPADAEGQPRLAQIGMIYLDDIEAEPRATSFYVRPDGWEMGAEAGAINGLTTEELAAKGVPVAEVLDEYEQAIGNGYVVSAFNAQFDTKVMRAELRRAGRDDLFSVTPNVCTMRGMQKVMGGRPNLASACEYAGIENLNAHDALADALAAMKLLKFLHSIGRMPEPTVKYAKNKPAAA